MQEKSSPLTLFCKPANKTPINQLPLALYASSSQQVQSLPALKKVSVYHFVDASPPEYNGEKSGNCQQCKASSSIQWRRGPIGAKTLCNSCGLRWKKEQERKDKVDEKSNITTELRTKEIKDKESASPHFFLKQLDNKPPAMEIGTVDPDKHQQVNNSGHQRLKPEQKPTSKLSISYLLNG